MAMTHEQDRERQIKEADEVMRMYSSKSESHFVDSGNLFFAAGIYQEEMLRLKRNPSPEVRELVEACKELRYQLARTHGSEEKIFADIVFGDIYKLILGAVARLEASK